jgi:DNA-binding NarL/FixJ family response regulator
MKDFTSAKQTINVLLIDDHQMILDGLAALISSENETIKVVGRTSDSEQIASLARELDPGCHTARLGFGQK